MSMSRNLSLIIFIIILSSCSRKPHNLTERKQYLIHYYDSGAFAKEVKKTVNRAIKRYDHKVCCGAQSAVIFDVDDTLLWSYEESKKIEFGFVPVLSHGWESTGNLPAVPHVTRLYDFFVEKGCKIILLSGRRSDEREATLRNLARIGVTKIDRLITRAPDEIGLSAAAYKNKHRALLAAQGYRIIADVGDQESDFAGGITGRVKIRIPNYTYTIG